ncbi:bifunctional adenosylcobinamide kinase/adenosylcobinamide-phosphate guanylyltransferase [Anoxynatronum sibiricum]|uniref:Adenosylcobinamide kinase n=1 Tax=Anoxynatronum sibiricum TaxID=210623 RepID=A0ABU9VRL2_9CLOT
MVENTGITLVTGGARSGKSRFGEGLFKKKSDKVLYIATAKAYDDEMRLRIQRHRQQRPSSWETLEAYYGFRQCLPAWQGKVEGIILDCITLMITHLMLENAPENWESLTPEALTALEARVDREMNELVKVLREMQVPAVLITNEVGMGIVPGDKMSRDFRDIAGRVNQRLAEAADQVFLVVSGIPLCLKNAASTDPTTLSID